MGDVQSSTYSVWQKWDGHVLHAAMHLYSYDTVVCRNRLIVVVRSVLLLCRLTKVCRGH